MLRGSTEILETVCSHLGGVKPGETTKDGKFTVIEVECQGACSNAPMLVVNDDFYVRARDPARCSAMPMFYKQEDLTPTTTKTILDAFSKGTKPKPGPQSGRHTSENSAGLTALTSKASPLHFVSGLSLLLTLLALCSHMALESIVNQNFNNASHRIEWGEYR
jgi:NADH dehydrogenase (ubiquinone) flavoprotein 2